LNTLPSIFIVKYSYCFRSSTNYDLPQPGVAYGKVVLIKKRLFLVGGLSPGIPTAGYIYEWTELQGWTIYSKLSPDFATLYLAAIPYNIN
jgi:hypothetical protein